VYYKIYIPYRFEGEVCKEQTNEEVTKVMRRRCWYSSIQCSFL